LLTSNVITLLNTTIYLRRQQVVAFNKMIELAYLPPPLISAGTPAG